MPAQKTTRAEIVSKKDSSDWLNRLLWPAFGIFCLCVLAGVGFHESWSDEAQSWLIARDCSLSQMFTILPGEGHPPLWFLVLFIPAKLGMPYQTIKWICALVMIAAVYLIQFRTRIPVLLKLLIPFSYFFFFEYSLLARSYCLIVFFIASILALYPERFEKPLLFALCIVGLFNTHVLVFSFATGFTVLYIIDAVQYKKLSGKVIGSFIMMCIGGFYLIPYLDTGKMAAYYNRHISEHTTQITTAIAHSLLIDGNIGFGVVLFTIFILLLAKRVKPLGILLCGMAGMLYITGYYYETKIRHHGILFIMMFAAYSLTFYYGESKFSLFKKTNARIDTYGFWGLAIVILLQLPSTVKSYYADMQGLYSGSKEAAEYLMDKKTDSTVIVAYQSTSTLSLLPYMNDGTRFYYAECERFGTYYIYDTCFRKEIWMYPVDYAVKVAHDHYAGKLNNILFLLNYPIQERTHQYLDLLYQTSEPTILWEETFYVYKFKDGVK